MAREYPVESWKAIQRQLKALGFDPGPIDGLRGRRTNRAIVAFKRARGLRPRPFYGPITHAALFPDGADAPPNPAPVTDMPWHERAQRDLGLREGPGSRNNMGLVSRIRDAVGWYPGDHIPWCGGIMAAWIAETLPDEPLPNNPLGARNWLQFGIPCDPRLGAVLVFWRGSRKGWKGHVGLYAGEDGSAYRVLGGNQSDAVTIARISKSRLLGARWPATADVPEGAGRRFVQGGGELSTNEA